MNDALRKYLKFQKDFFGKMKSRGDLAGHTEDFHPDLDTGLDGTFRDGWHHEFASLLDKHDIDKNKFWAASHKKGMSFYFQGPRLVYLNHHTGHRVGDLLEAVAEVIE
jgi:hypothetical protein